MRRYQLRYALPVLLGLMILIQSGAWWAGRNNRLPWGWLPVQVITTPQKILDDFVARASQSNQSPPIRLVSIVPGPRSERWSVEHSFVVNRIGPGSVLLDEVDAYVSPQILNGVFPERLLEADLIMIDPEAVFYPTVFSSLSQQRSGFTRKRLHPHLEVILWSDRARRDLGNTF